MGSQLLCSDNANISLKVFFKHFPCSGVLEAAWILASSGRRICGQVSEYIIILLSEWILCEVFVFCQMVIVGFVISLANTFFFYWWLSWNFHFVTGSTCFLQGYHSSHTLSREKWTFPSWSVRQGVTQNDITISFYHNSQHKWTSKFSINFLEKFHSTSLIC